MNEPIRTAEALDIDARLAAAKPRPQSFDWPMVLQEGARFVVLLGFIAAVFAVCLTREGM
jgi:hypothetical protein